MKRKGYYLCSLLVMIFVFLSCRDEEQDCTQAMQGLCPSLQAEFPGGGAVLSALSFPPLPKTQKLGSKTGQGTDCGGFSV